MRMSSVGRTTRSTGRQSGVTLIEMLVVVTIIGLIAGLISINVFKQGESAKRKLAGADISTFVNALNLYKFDTGSFPTTEQGLQALRVQPEGVVNWTGPYLQRDVPLDQWGHPYLYKYPGEHGDAPDIVSLAADGQPGGEGNNADVVSWKNN
jgi:general secretion pathway protein G